MEGKNEHGGRLAKLAKPRDPGLELKQNEDLEVPEILLYTR
jgi:hypothetical protein